MLILSRKVNESITIGDDITITVLGISGKGLRIGVDAPKHIPVHRTEVYDKIHSRHPEENDAPQEEVDHD